MADVKQMRIFCAEQIEVPPTLPEILKNGAKSQTIVDTYSVLAGMYQLPISKLMSIKEVWE